MESASATCECTRFTELRTIWTDDPDRERVRYVSPAAIMGRCWTCDHPLATTTTSTDDNVRQGSPQPPRRHTLRDIQSSRHGGVNILLSNRQSDLPLSKIVHPPNAIPHSSESAWSPHGTQYSRSLERIQGVTNSWRTWSPPTHSPRLDLPSP